MDWLDNMNKAIEYIESNLTDEFSYERASRIACCSVFHFQRMFSYIAGVSLSEYIRRRKMTLAAFDLQSTEELVIDLSLKYGYESPTAFNRAFQGIHGISPSKARKAGSDLKAYPKISFTISIKGEEQMNYRIVEKEEFRIIGFKEHYEMNVDEAFAKVPLFWQKIIKEGRVPKILSMMNKKPFGLLGVSTCMNGKDFDYYIAVASDIPISEDLSEYKIPSGTWAIFECIGPMPDSIQSLQRRIVTEWLPTSGYEYANAPDIEVYYDGDQQSKDYKSEVWLPIVKNKQL